MASRFLVLSGSGIPTLRIPTTEVGDSPGMHLLAHERNAFLFVGDDAEAVAQLRAQMQNRLAGADDGNSHQIARQLDAGVEVPKGTTAS